MDSCVLGAHLSYAGLPAGGYGVWIMASYNLGESEMNE